MPKPLTFFFSGDDSADLEILSGIEWPTLSKQKIDGECLTVAQSAKISKFKIFYFLFLSLSFLDKSKLKSICLV